MDCLESAAEERTLAVTVFRPNFDPFVATGESWMNFHNNDNCTEATSGR